MYNFDFRNVQDYIKFLNGEQGQGQGQSQGSVREEDWTEDFVADYLSVALQTESMEMLRALLGTKTDVWVKFVQEQVFPEYREDVGKFLKAGAIVDFFVALRYMYAQGQPVMDDQSYDVLEEIYLKVYPELNEIHTRTYEEDVPSETVVDFVGEEKVNEIQQMKLETEARVESLSEGEKETLDLDKTTSIRPVLSAREAFEFWTAAPMVPVHFSLKVDGVNTKLLFQDGNLAISLSRGRKGDSIDYTLGAKEMLRKYQLNGGLDGRVLGETAFNPTKIPWLNERVVGRDYKTPKSTAMAMLRSSQNFGAEEYEFLDFFAFAKGELPVDKAFEELKADGFNVPPYIVVQPEDIPRDNLEHFSQWLEDTILNPLERKGRELNIGSDGVVMYLMESMNTERADVYSDDNIALKFGPWASAGYRSRVVDMKFEQRRVGMSVVLIVEPVKTRDLNTATRVNVGSVAILVKDGIHIGDTIEFTRKSEAYNVYVRKVVE